MFELVQVGSDQEEVGTRFDGEETRSRNVDSVCVLEVCEPASNHLSSILSRNELRAREAKLTLDSSSNSGFKLNNSFTLVGLFAIDDEST